MKYEIIELSAELEAAEEVLNDGVDYGQEFKEELEAHAHAVHTKLVALKEQAANNGTIII